MRTLQFTGPNSISISEIPLSDVAPDQTLVVPAFVGLCGTDLELYRGSMPYLSQGLAAYPIQPGHEISGWIVDSPDDPVPNDRPVVVDPVVGCGCCPACLQGLAARCPDRSEIGLRRGWPGGAADYVVVPRRNLHPIPPNVSLREATLVEPGVTALHAVTDLGDVNGSRGLVVGAGTLGLISAQLLMSRGSMVDVLAIDPHRAELVDALGLHPVSRVRSATYDYSIEAAGVAEALNATIDAVIAGGIVSLIGVHAGPIDQFDVNQVVLKNARLHGVLNGPGLFDHMLQEIGAGRVDVRALIDREVDLDDASKALIALCQTNRSKPKILLRVTG